MPKLCQIIAITNTRKSTVQKEVTELHHQATKEALLTGISRTYTPKDENGEKQPAENKMVQVKAPTPCGRRPRRGRDCSTSSPHRTSPTARPRPT